MKSILFVINTMGVGGGERSLLELLRHMDLECYEVSLFVLTNQGELISQIPERIHLLNTEYFPVSVLNRSGKRRLFKTALRAMVTRGTVLKRLGYLLSNLSEMLRKGEVRKDKLLWKILSDGAPRWDKEYDLAVAYLEGGAAYYVDSYVKARKKAVFIHIDYKQAGYSRKLDEECYLRFDHVLTVSENVKKSFLSVYPECTGRTEVFHNLIDKSVILSKAKERGGFSDQYDGFRILTVARLVPQKAIDVAIDTMKILRDAGQPIRWYVLGEGDLRKKLEDQIALNDLEEDFLLLGTVDNPYPYYAQSNLYVHMANFEGKSVAIEEAQILGCAILVSEYMGVREQVEDDVDGKICPLDPEIMAREILELVNDPERLEIYGINASRREQVEYTSEMDKLIKLVEIGEEWS